jgi:hypothetical protein
MSRGRRREPVPRAIAALGRRVARWRASREKRSPMPEPLWQEARRLASMYGVSRVCRHVGLGYASLQQRVEASRDQPTQEKANESGFVELSASQILGASSMAQTVLELSDRQGTRLTLRLAAGSDLDVKGLVEGFRGRGR